ncbi:MAG: hypothetical protein P4L45_14670 [Ignavibacteriaceae bacterium]|nr:hypothetical protein [Ignavibacteriaceae bacterium]
MSTIKNQSLIISYLSMRRFIGVLGIALPIIIVFGGFIQNGFVVLDSLSNYYYTNMRDFFIGLLFGISIFLISYTGYEKVDNIVGNLSGIFAMGIVLFPVSMYCGREVKVGIFLVDDTISGYVHLIFSALFFLSLSFNSIFLFTKHGPGRISREKRHRNIIYRACGIIMVVCMLCIIIYTSFLKNTVVWKIHPVLILESVALFAFGISWLVKGNTLYKDKTIEYN